MKTKIHPEYKKAKVTCACGNTFETRSTVGDINVEICAACHPFFTGKQKLIDTAGRVEKYMKKYKLHGKEAEAAKGSGKPAEAKAEMKEESEAAKAKTGSEAAEASRKEAAEETAQDEKTS